MSVNDYVARFSELYRHALMILPTDVERVWRFVVGLHPGFRASIVQEVEMGTAYQLVVEISWRIEGYRQRGREQMQQDKRTRFFGEFIGAPTRGRGQFGKGQPSRPTYPAPPPPRDALVRPYFSAMLESSYRPPAHQGSSGAYFSAILESSYYPPAIQGSSSGYSGHQVQTSGQQSMVPRVLFDPRSTYSYVSSLFAYVLDIPRESLGTPIYVSTPVSDYVIVDQIYRSCVVTFCGYETRADLLLLDMTDFEVILGMDWLSPYYAILDCYAKAVTLAMLEFPRLEWKGSSVSTSSRVISFLKARHMVEKGYLGYLAYVRDTTAGSPTIDLVQ
ncbi:uncharacterized protein [Nicotiana sylvestris]|uniref:uncharacterized protein n=1 Tax=Nicotiana sylvestris TaxID=4096 RepID=UPI00388CB3E5